MRRLVLLAALLVAACNNSTPVQTKGRPVVKAASPGVVTIRPTFAPTDAPLTDPTPLGTASAASSPNPTPAPPTPAPQGALALVLGAEPADSWSVAPGLTRPRAGAAAGVLNAMPFVFSGEAAASTERFDPAAGAWHLDSSLDDTLHLRGGLPGGSARMATGTLDGLLYVGGGSGGGTPDGSLSCFHDPVAFFSLGYLALPVDAPAGGCIGSRFIVAGGVAADSSLTDVVQRFEVAHAEKMDKGHPMPLAIAGAASAVLDGELYVLGGYTLNDQGQPVPSKVVQVYDPGTDTWTSSLDAGAGAPKPLTAARHSGAATVLDGRLFLTGGVGAGDALLGTVEELTATGWQPRAALPTSRALLSLLAFQGRLWAVGGIGAARQTLTTVECYTP